MFLHCNIMEECIICFEETEEQDFVIFPCRHKTCIKCYPLILNERPYCPLCNASLIIEHTSLIIEHTSLNIEHASLNIEHTSLEHQSIFICFLLLITAIFILYFKKYKL